MRILFLLHSGTNSRDIFLDIMDGYREAGHEVFALELGALWDVYGACQNEHAQAACVQLFSQTVHTFVESNRIELCVCMWANGPYSLTKDNEKSFFEGIGLPVLMHWLDAPHWAHGGAVLSSPSWLFNGPHSYHYINNPVTAHEMVGVLGWDNVITAGNAASPTVFHPHPSEKRDIDILFGVGADHVEPTPLMLSELQKNEPDVLSIRREASVGIREALCGIAEPVWEEGNQVEAFVDRMIEMRLECRDMPVLEQMQSLAQQETSMARSILSLLQNPRQYVSFSMKLRTIESWERAFTFVYLCRYFKCATFGISEPFKSWPGTWEYLGNLAYRDQSKAYSRARFGLNVMRWQDDNGLNLKPFEITLSGSCLLQAYRPGIDSYFGDGEAVVFRTLGECRERVQQLLADDKSRERISLAGRARSLEAHCWHHRAQSTVEAITGQTSQPMAKARTEETSFEDGDGLVFVLGGWRGGTTLLRKVLGSHSMAYAPAETWFLLSLINMWEGEGSDKGSTTHNVAAALQGHLTPEEFLSCSRAFAARFYRLSMPVGAKYYVDKTPFYIRIANILPNLFPRARFLVLSRDPRGAAWSRHTWKHATSKSVEEHFEAVAQDNRILFDFLNGHADKSLHVSYERLCCEPEEQAYLICEFLGLPFEPGMVQYGMHNLHEGYGDEKTCQHSQPHTSSIDRWSGDGGMSMDQQIALAQACGVDTLRRFGYGDLAAMIDEANVAGVHDCGR